MAGATNKTDSKKGKGPWMTDTEEKLSQAIAIGVRSSTKAETRTHRVQFYQEQLTAATLQVAYYGEMLRLEEAKAGLFERESVELEAEMRLLTLRDQAAHVRGVAVGLAGRTATLTATLADDDEGTVVVESSVKERRW